MTKQTKLIDHFDKLNDNYTVTNCHNGYVVEVSRQRRKLDQRQVRLQDAGRVEGCGAGSGVDAEDLANREY